MEVLGRYFVIRSKLNDLVLDIKGADMEQGQRVQTYEFHGNDNQLWYEDPLRHVIRSKADDKFVLDLDEGE